MIDLDNYKRAIEWMQRGVAEHASSPGNDVVRDSVTLSFEVTYNLSESILRQALSELKLEEGVALLSSRELMRYAADHGLTLSSAERWLSYGIAIERTLQPNAETFDQHLAPVLSEYLTELRAFSQRLEQRLVTVV